ncbi:MULTISPECIES: Acg family FMN-binding oxidoreductase [unclassified Rhodococcus (in: high G+C Gram-positive bacteria)]|uniref:Acg family FMN-binding oxidoreductase n=1 Tax=unclassified Rhodococcus (in: high G+C Gram-positive bacteria) TaxID=192944 RepID=UPI00092AAE16|nr:nitroreductase family protein [Rhodococcus sp. M8]OLL20895.1 hypothetical protein BKE56_013645 [Rhodococcus sp. M8]QPG44741.1 hypothetical protein ISO16_23240 [Rhodococcus sp. M8]
MVTEIRPDTAAIRDAVESACRAPSLHNSQPWRWEWTGERLELYAVAERMLGHTDPSGRQLVLGCGAALHHARVALSAASWIPTVTRLPDPSRPDLLAVLDFDRPHTVDARDAALALAIDARHTDRRPFAAPTTLRESLVDLENAARREGASLSILDAEARSDLARASELSAAIREGDEAYRQELAWWTGRAEPGDTGVPASALLDDEAAGDIDVGRRFPTGAGTLDTAQPKADASALAVLSTRADERIDWLRAGEAMSAVLLEATAAHLATCPLTHVTEIEASRGIVRTATARTGEVAGFPQVVIRLGARSARGLPTTSRRPVDEVFVDRSGRDG